MSAPMVSVASERTLFLGPRIPDHVKHLGKHLTEMKKPVFRQMLKLIMQDFEGKTVTHEMYQSVKSATSDNSNVDICYGGLYALLKCALSLPETSLKPEIFKDDLRELKILIFNEYYGNKLKLRITAEYIEDLANVVHGQRRSAILSSINIQAPKLPKLDKLRWRVDVAISTSTLSRVLEPAIVFDVQLSDGSKETFEVHPSQFHRLRFAVATLLKEMENLEMRSILKN